MALPCIQPFMSFSILQFGGLGVAIVRAQNEQRRGSLFQVFWSDSIHYPGRPGAHLRVGTHRTQDHRRGSIRLRSPQTTTANCLRGG